MFDIQAIHPACQIHSRHKLCSFGVSVQSVQCRTMTLRSAYPGVGRRAAWFIRVWPHTGCSLTSAICFQSLAAGDPCPSAPARLQLRGPRPAGRSRRNRGKARQYHTLPIWEHLYFGRASELSIRLQRTRECGDRNFVGFSGVIKRDCHLCQAAAACTRPARSCKDNSSESCPLSFCVVFIVSQLYHASIAALVLKLD